MCKFNEDTHRNNQINKHLDEQDGNAEVTVCCGSTFTVFYDDESILCDECDNETSTTLKSDFDTDRYENEMNERADAERELRRKGL